MKYTKTHLIATVTFFLVCCTGAFAQPDQVVVESGTVPGRICPRSTETLVESGTVPGRICPRSKETLVENGTVPGRICPR